MLQIYSTRDFICNFILGRSIILYYAYMLYFIATTQINIKFKRDWSHV